MAVQLPPIPAGATGELARCCVTSDRSGWRTAWLIGGLRHEPFGPPYPTPTAACRASRQLNDRVDAMRASA